MHHSALLLLGLAAALGAPLAIASSGATDAVTTTVRKKGKGFQLVRDGEPFFVKGAGGRDHLDQLVEAGGNSIRTWGVGPDTKRLLDEAHREGLTVTLGVWLERVGTGFDYGSERALERQTRKVRVAVERYRDHPALLMWSLGNEGEGDGGDTRYYEHLEALAQLVHELDPAHPTMTVIAELGDGEKKVRDLEHLAPSIDVVGINSYGSIASVPRRYRAAGGSRPYVVTEFGPRGHWESERTEWGTPIEMSSTEKAALYRSAYEDAVEDQPMCVGAYVFLWGQKQETTATWFGMFLADGTRLGAVDAMAELWTGKKPKNRAPEIVSLTVDRDSVEPGKAIRATLKAKDPDRDELKVEWILRRASAGNGSWGAAEDAMEAFPRAIVTSKAKSAKVRMPEEPGAYRLFAYVRDGKGNGAVHNVPVRVEE